MDVDPNASIRAELLGQIMAAQLAIDAAIAELTRSGMDSVMLAQAQSQRASLGDIRQQIGTVSGSALASMRSEIVAAVTAATAVAQQAMGSGGASAAGGAADIAAQRAAARETVQSVATDIFDKKVFDPYLRFASEQDAENYRKRERERQTYIREQLSAGTPEGTARAAEATLEQIDDAGRHGADQSPRFADIRRRASDARNVLQEAAQEAAPAKAEQAAPRAERSELDDVMAALKVAGVETTGKEATPASGHGVTVAAATSRAKDGPARG